MFRKSVNILPANIKSMNPLQKNPHITELFARTLKMSAIMFLFPINSLIFQEHVKHQNYEINNFSSVKK